MLPLAQHAHPPCPPPPPIQTTAGLRSRLSTCRRNNRLGVLFPSQQDLFNFVFFPVHFLYSAIVYFNTHNNFAHPLSRIPASIDWPIPHGDNAKPLNLQPVSSRPSKYAPAYSTTTEHLSSSAPPVSHMRHQRIIVRFGFYPGGSTTPREHIHARHFSATQSFLMPPLQTTAAQLSPANDDHDVAVRHDERR